MTEFVRDKDCLVCGPGVLIELDTSVTLQKVIQFLMDLFVSVIIKSERVDKEFLLV